MATEPKDRPHGDLNPWSRKKRNTVSDTDLLRKQKDDHVNPDILTELPGPLLGIALENGVRVPAPYSITEPSRTKENKKDVLIVRAKIIEQDCSPHPSEIINFHCADGVISESELFSIHDIFVAVNSEIDDSPAPGDLVFVDYENRRTRSGPKYFGLKERSTEGLTPGRAVSAIKKFNTPATTPSLASTTAPPNAGSPLPTITPITSTYTPSVPISQLPCIDNFDITLGAPIPAAIQPLMNMIASGEGGYNSMNQGTATDAATGKEIIIGSTHNSTQKLGKNLTDMTFTEILYHQSQTDLDKKLFAAGKYQITPNTMKYIVKEMKIPLTAKFDQANQESMGLGLIKYKRPEVWQYLLGQNNDEFTALLNLSKEWASLPNPQTGLSYHGGANRSSHTIQKVQDSLNSARAQITANCPK